MDLCHFWHHQYFMTVSHEIRKDAQNASIMAERSLIRPELMRVLSGLYRKVLWSKHGTFGAKEQHLSNGQQKWTKGMKMPFSTFGA